MANLNNVQIIGRLGKDPESRYTTNSKHVCKFSVGVDAYVPANSDRPKHCEWFNVVCWEKLADVCVQYLSKGDLVYCQGELNTREYEKDGQRKYFTELNMRSMQMLKTKPKEGQSERPGRAPEQTQVPDFDDDIPF